MKAKQPAPPPPLKTTAKVVHVQVDRKVSYLSISYYYNVS